MGLIGKKNPCKYLIYKDFIVLAETRGAIYTFQPISPNISIDPIARYSIGLFDSSHIKPYHLITLIFGT